MLLLLCGGQSGVILGEPSIWTFHRESFTLSHLCLWHAHGINKLPAFCKISFVNASRLAAAWCCLVCPENLLQSVVPQSAQVSFRGTDLGFMVARRAGVAQRGSWNGSTCRNFCFLSFLEMQGSQGWALPTWDPAMLMGVSKSCDHKIEGLIDGYRPEQCFSVLSPWGNPSRVGSPGFPSQGFCCLWGC